MNSFEISRKTSLVLSLAEKYEEKRKSSVLSEKEKEPKDPFYLVHILCFFTGFMNLMPMLFFNTAQTYWMFKFRNTSIDSEYTNGTDRSVLQSYYQSVSQVAGTIPNVVCTVLFTIYGHKWSAMIRTITSLIILLVLYTIFIILTQIDSDSWQTEFFVLTILLLLVNSACVATFQMSTVVIVARLHHRYLFFFLLGQNGTFLTTTLQIISLAVTEKCSTAGLIYFSAGTVLIGLTLVLMLFGKKSRIFKYYNVVDNSEEKTQPLNWEETKQLLKKIWPCLVLPSILIANSTFIHPAISTLIVSENDGDGSEWATKYFTPVIIFLVMELTTMAGRMCSKGFTITHSNKWFYLSAAIVRMAITIPFYMFCNAKPRHLPVIFKKDWEVVVGQIINSLAFGFMFNVSFMSVKQLAGKLQEEALKLLTLTISIVIAACSANGIIMVKLL